jgi:hypothetical protein
LPTRPFDRDEAEEEFGNESGQQFVSGNGAAFYSASPILLNGLDGLSAWQ